MCRPATCKECGKATYVGCGAHVEQVLGGVAPADPHPPSHHPRRAATHLCVNHLAPLPKMLLVDEDALVRAGLRMIVSSAEDLEVDTPNSLEQQLS